MESSFFVANSLNNRNSLAERALYSCGGAVRRGGSSTASDTALVLGDSVDESGVVGPVAMTRAVGDSSLLLAQAMPFCPTFSFRTVLDSAISSRPKVYRQTNAAGQRYIASDFVNSPPEAA